MNNLKNTVKLSGRIDSGNSQELIIKAAVDKLQTVTGFVGERLRAAGCTAKALMQTELAVEEIFVNIANYAYAPGEGDVTVRVETGGEPLAAVITFIDRGAEYDPLKKDDPDITLSAEERQIGGLGIFMTKKVMDEVSYTYRDGQNILTLKKIL